VADAAGERPSSIDDKAAIDRAGAAGRPQGPGDDGVRRAVDLARGILGQECRPQAISGAQHQVPCRCGVGAGDLLNDDHRGDRVDFEAAQRLRDVHPEQPRLVHRRQYRRRQPPVALALVAAGAHQRRDAPCGLDQRRIRDRPVHHAPASCSSSIALR
jgi:hypothetical protein